MRALIVEPIGIEAIPFSGRKTAPPDGTRTRTSPETCLTTPVRPATGGIAPEGNSSQESAIPSRSPSGPEQAPGRSTAGGCVGVTGGAGSGWGSSRTTRIASEEASQTAKPLPSAPAASFGLTKRSRSAMLAAGLNSPVIGSPTR